MSAKTERTVALMPAVLGVLGWSPEERNLVTLAHQRELPFADYSIDRVLLVHTLETEPAQPIRDIVGHRRPFCQVIMRPAPPEVGLL